MRLWRFLPLLALPAALFPALPAGASVNEPHQKALSEVRAPAREVVRVQAPAPDPRVLVQLGDTLWGIGTRTHRSWTALATYNRIPNPDLIYVGQVVRIPPASYDPPPVAQPTVSPRVTQTVSPRITHTVAPVTASTQATASAPAANGSFQACVAFRESTDGAGSSNIYGIEPYIWTQVLGRSGSPYTASRATQDAAFNQLYQEQGSRPWAPYDGC